MSESPVKIVPTSMPMQTLLPFDVKTSDTLVDEENQKQKEEGEKEKNNNN